MSCPSCARVIERSVKKVDGVESVHADVKKGEVEVEYDKAKNPMENVLQAIKKMGYKPSLPDSVAGSR
jgi:copper chaperone CopZ